LVRAYSHTYNLPVTLSNCSNNYGPYQFPEKLIPLMIFNMLQGKSLPVYGDGKNIRDWLYVEDHNSAVWEIMRNGTTGETYNIGGENEWENIKLLNVLIDIVAAKTKLDPVKVRNTITYIKDRPGHDRRYAIDCSKIKNKLGWKQDVSFEEGLSLTVDWYLANSQWIDSILNKKTAAAHKELVSYSGFFKKFISYHIFSSIIIPRYSLMFSTSLTASLAGISRRTSEVLLSITLIITL
jgi:dTDP-glucose 4,6-dehydratase